MGMYLTDEEKRALREAPAGSAQWRCIDIIRQRAEKGTQENAFVHPGDTQEWYHLCWERMSDAAFLWSLEPSDHLGQWIHHRAMEIAAMPVEEWLGPWFRQGGGGTPAATLETSHITLALCEALGKCPDLFTLEEQEAIHNALRDKGLLLCRRFCLHTVTCRDVINNWFMVILNGYGTAALLLEDESAIHEAWEWSRIAGALYGDGDYGESLQYSNYASLHLAHLNEMLLRSGRYQPDELAMEGYARLMPWYAASYLHNKPMAGFEEAAPRSFNFGDSAAVFRPSGDLLAQVAARMGDRFPREAGLASWLFAETYQDRGTTLSELATFGFYNHFGYCTALLLPDMAPPLSPQEAGLPIHIAFSGGQIFLRDSWASPRAALAIQAGYEPYNVTAHRHRDQNSFQLVVGRERMLIDPGHCCYRLKSQAESTAAKNHNAILLTRGGHELPQKEVGGNIFRRQEPLNRLLCNRLWGDVRVVVSDAAALYDGVEIAARIWVARLPGILFVADVVRADEPVALVSCFAANNQDNDLRVNHATGQRLVLRRGGEGLKLFAAWARADGEVYLPELELGWGYAHTYYHPKPNQDGQGREGSALCYGWKGPEARMQARIHTLIMDTSEGIVGWHVYVTEDGFTRIEPPDKTLWLDMKVEDGGFVLRHPEQGMESFCLIG